LEIVTDAVPYELMQAAYERDTLDRYASGKLKFVIVADADALLSSIDHQCRTGWTSKILRLAESRTSVVFAEDHVYGEVYRGFEKISVWSGTPPYEMRACFEEEYLPVLRWVKTDGAGISDIRVAWVTDQTDVPTAELASLIAPCLVLSGDKSLRRPGFAPNEWRQAATHGTEIVAGVQVQEGGTLIVGLPVAGVVGGGIELGKKVGIPWWGSVGIMALLAYLVLRSPDRRQTIGEKVLPAIEMFMQLMEQAYQEERRATQQLKEMLCPSADPPTVKQQIATVLARCPGPLLAKEIQELVDIHFEVEPRLSEIRGVLQQSPEFGQPERYRWQLGRRAAPWRPANHC
jgi:hypothetical protein